MSYTLYRTVSTLKPGEKRTSFKDTTRQERVGSFASMNDDEAARYSVALVAWKYRLQLPYPRTGSEARAILRRHDLTLLHDKRRVA
jgi:hypothetical protein